MDPVPARRALRHIPALRLRTLKKSSSSSRFPSDFKNIVGTATPAEKEEEECELCALWTAGSCLTCGRDSGAIEEARQVAIRKDAAWAAVLARRTPTTVVRSVRQRGGAAHALACARREKDRLRWAGTPTPVIPVGPGAYIIGTLAAPTAERSARRRASYIPCGPGGRKDVVMVDGPVAVNYVCRVGPLQFPIPTEECFTPWLNHTVDVVQTPAVALGYRNENLHAAVRYTNLWESYRDAPLRVGISDWFRQHYGAGRNSGVPSCEIGQGPVCEPRLERWSRTVHGAGRNCGVPPMENGQGPVSHGVIIGPCKPWTGIRGLSQLFFRPRPAWLNRRESRAQGLRVPGSLTKTASRPLVPACLRKLVRRRPIRDAAASPPAGYCYTIMFKTDPRVVGFKLRANPLVADVAQEMSNEQSLRSYTFSVSGEKVMHVQNTPLPGILSLPFTAIAHAHPTWRIGVIEPRFGSQNDDQSRDRGRETSVIGEERVVQIPDLNNAFVVVDESLFSAETSPNDPRIGADTIPRLLLDDHPVVGWQTDGQNAEAYLTWGRESFFYRHYPDASNALMERFSSTPNLTPICEESQIPDGYLRSRFRPKYHKGFLFQPTAAGTSPLEEYYRPNCDMLKMRDAEALLGTKRFTSVRGNRQIQGWEAQANERTRDMAILADAENCSQLYFSFMFNLWRMYFQAQTEAAIPSTTVNNVRVGWSFHNPAGNANGLPFDMAYDTRNPRPFNRATGADIPLEMQVIPISASLVPGPQNMGVNPEDAFWANGYQGIAEVQDGSAVFIDHVGLTVRQVGLAIRAFGPQSWYGRREIHHAGDVDYSTPLEYMGFEGNSYQNDPAGVLKVYLHMGMEQPPINPEFTYFGRARNAQLADPARSPWNIAYSAAEIRTVMEHFATKHHAWADCWAAYDAVVYRQFGVVIRESPSISPNAAEPNEITSAFLSPEVYLPKNYTLPAYFDAFRSPMPASVHGQDVLAIWNLTPKRFMWLGYTACLAHASSVTWATRSMSISGEVINAMTTFPAGGNDYLRNHTAMFGLRMHDESLSPLACMHAKATRVMYGFRPTDYTLLTSNMVPKEHVWSQYLAPHLVNHYHDMWLLKTMPRSYLLPTRGSLPMWPINENRPTIARGSSTKIRVARDTDAFTGRAYVQDGGMIANLQHYAAVGTHRGYRYHAAGADSHARMSLGIWSTPFQYEWPAAANIFALPSLGARHTPFADFLAPVILSYRVIENRIKALGICTAAQGVDADTTKSLSDSWFDMSSAATPRSLAISYMHPLGAKYQDEPVNDYSMLIFGTESGVFSHVEFHDSSPLRNALAPAAHDSLGNYSTAPAPPFFSSALANANPPAMSGPPAHPITSGPNAVNVRNPPSRAQSARTRDTNAKVRMSKKEGPIMKRMRMDAEESARAAEVKRITAEITANMGQTSTLTPAPAPANPSRPAQPRNRPVPPVPQPTSDSRSFVPRQVNAAASSSKGKGPAARPAGPAYVQKNPNFVAPIPDSQQVAALFEPTTSEIKVALPSQAVAAVPIPAQATPLPPGHYIGPDGNEYGPVSRAPTPTHWGNVQSVVGPVPTEPVIPNDSAAPKTQQMFLQNFPGAQSQHFPPAVPRLGPDGQAAPPVADQTFLAANATTGTSSMARDNPLLLFGGDPQLATRELEDSVEDFSSGHV